MRRAIDSRFRRVSHLRGVWAVVLALLLSAALFGLGACSQLAGDEASGSGEKPAAEVEASAPEGPSPDDLADIEQLSGWVEGPDGELRYFDPQTHALYGGWLAEDGDIRYIDGDSGQAHVGWLDLDGHRFWCDDGTHADVGALMPDQWLDLDGERYLLDANGAVTTGWLAEGEDAWYYFDETGASRTGLIDDGSGKVYWLKDDNTLANHEWIEIDGLNYAFDDDGSLVTLGEVVPPGDEENLASLTSRQQAVIDACETTPWPGRALCAAWVSNVFAAAGEPSVGGNACDIARAWCTSTDLAELEPGMIIAVESHSRTDNGRIWGHVCIYIGGGVVCESGTLGLRHTSLGSWLAWFGDTMDPRWGWANGIDLSE